MKELFIILLIMSFISIAVFGVFSMHSEMQNHNDNCIAAAVQGIDCPKQNNIFDFLFFHFSAFKNLLIVISGNSVFLLSIFYSFIIWIAMRVLFGNSGLPIFSFTRYKLKQFKLFSLLFRYKFFYWLALHENSPTAL